MTRWLLLAALVASLSFLCTPTSRADDAEVKEAIKARNEKYNNALKEKSAALLMDIYADDYVFISDEGEQFDRDQTIKDALDAGFRLDESKADESNVRLLSETVAVENSKWTAAGLSKNKPFHATFRYTSVWAKRNGKWLLVSEDETRVKDTKKDDAAAVEEIKKLEQQWTDAYKARDEQKMAELLDDSWTISDQEGKQSKQHYLEDMKHVKEESDTFDEMDVRILGETAIVTGLYTMKATYDDKDISGTIRFTDTFAKRDGSWKVVASHESRIAAKK